MNKYIYRATNIDTGEIIQGTAKEIFIKTGIFTQLIYKYAGTCEVYKGTWKFEKLSKE